MLLAGRGPPGKLCDGAVRDSYGDALKASRDKFSGKKIGKDEAMEAFNDRNKIKLDHRDLMKNQKERAALDLYKPPRTFDNVLVCTCIDLIPSVC